jgi:anti-sigma regulatory factor (Ser/Thr protein kinase)
MDPDSGSVTLANAGHPPPALLGTDGRVRFLETEQCLPLGIDVNAAPVEHVHPIAAGDTLLLFTDGLIERRHESIEIGLGRLHDALDGASEDLENLCDRVLEHMLGQHPSQDDVALLAVRLVEQTVGPFELKVPATADSIPVVRHQLRAWLKTVGPPVERSLMEDIELACSEACTNAVRHAYGPADATFSVRAELEEDDFLLEVSDQGKWREPRGDGGGWGLRLIREVCEAVELDRLSTGTRLRMRLDLRPRVPS